MKEKDKKIVGQARIRFSEDDARIWDLTEEDKEFLDEILEK
jgi:hypothetical protein